MTANRTRRFATAMILLVFVALVGQPVAAVGPAPGLPPERAVGAAASGAAVDEDWPDWRGPRRDGTSTATDLPESWAPDGDNVAWHAPYGGRSAPVVMGDRLYLQNAAGEGPEMQERVMAFDADTGEVLWEHRVNITLSDVPPHRVGWASPVVDRETGNVYALTVGGTLFGLSPAGELLWEIYLSEVFGLASTHGGRTVSPIIEDGNVIIGGITGGWGALARGFHRFIAVDKERGQVAWVTTSQNQPFDTTYSPPYVTEIDGERLLITGAGDGAVHALRPSTGELVWRFGMSKRGINTGVSVVGSTVIVSHGEENLEDSTMGLVAAIDGTAEGDLGADAVRWQRPGILNGYSSPVLDGDVYYQIDNAANLRAFAAETGEELWLQNLGTIQRASPVLADGKLYVGTMNGEFFIIRPGESGAEILDRDQLGSEDEIEEVVASVAVARGRVYLVSHSNLWAIGPEEPRESSGFEMAAAMPSSAPVAHVQVFPKELMLRPGDQVDFEARLFDADGRYIRTETEGVEWTVAGIDASISATGALTVAESAGPAAGAVSASVDGVDGSARMRTVPPLPWDWSFDGLQGVPPFWIGALGKFVPEDRDGNGVLVKTNDNPFLKRTKVYLGATDTSDYTVQIDFSTSMERRRMGDAGVIAQRYALIVFGARQRLELQSWQPETERTISVPFSARPDTWYTVKLTTTNLDDGSVRVRGKAWPRDEPEPAEWAVDTTDPIGTRKGSPGFYADAHAVITFDNLKVEANQ